MAECHWTGPRLPAIHHHLVADCQCRQPHRLGWASTDASCSAGSGGEGRCPPDPADLMDSDKRTRCLGPSHLDDDCDGRMCPSGLADDFDGRMCPSGLADSCDGRMCPSCLADDDGFWYSKARVEISEELFSALYTN